MTYLESLQGALIRILETHPEAHIIGEDIVDPYGGAFKVTKGLSARFPERVISTPISEASIAGIAAGMACRGIPTVAEIMFADFVTLCTDQIVNHVTKFQAMYGKPLDMPLVIRTATGGGRGYGPTHSQSLEKLFMGIPHLQILAPTHFHDPGSLLEQALATRRPILFLEHKLLYPVELQLTTDAQLSVKYEKSKRGWPTAVVRNYTSGTPDVTIISYGGTALLTQQVLERLVKEEIRLTACFPSEIQPVPTETMITSCKNSKRVIVIEEGWRSFGWGAEVAAVLQEVLWDTLVTPVRRIGAKDTVIPNARQLEAEVLPSAESIEQAITEVIEAG